LSGLGILCQSLLHVLSQAVHRRICPWIYSNE
jgi:hypothetical protein